jgi:hypothetical protein
VPIQSIPVGRLVNDEERGWIMTMLTGLPEEFAIYSTQLDGLRYVSTCGCGCGTLHLEVAEDAPRGPHKGAVISDGLADYDDDCDVKFNETILFIRDGALESLEFVRYGTFSGMTRPVRVYLKEPRDGVTRRTISSTLKDEPHAS